jgi:hypothetical protein
VFSPHSDWQRKASKCGFLHPLNVADFHSIPGVEPGIFICHIFADPDRETPNLKYLFKF